MELRQLRYFVAVAEEANFTRAATRLHLTQPGLSAQIKQLEHELGQQLLDRSTRSVTLTPVGAAVLTHAKAALEAAERITHTVDEFTGLLRGHVRVGMISGAANDEVDIARVLAEYHRDHPQIAISLTEDTSEAMYAALRHGELDIALLGLTGAELDPAVEAETVFDSVIVAAVATDATGFGDRITLTELCEHSLICLPRGTGIRGVLERSCATAGLVPDVAFEAAAPPLLIRLAAHGLGVAVVPPLREADAAALGVRMLDIDPSMSGRLALAWNRERPLSPAAKILLGQIRIAFRGWKNQDTIFVERQVRILP
ncbi:LysR family transcriptional regulator [Nocardia sp. SYP-A9097]|uniref:LysR family transcriptional regulator n=1 Tax=Nocardia sp. SYP-A9097 TaxID=2663237 RepID=UPI00129A2C4D|nr:LysR family transcriptional regulator [Nocardia sp. SYP-A9097]MRH89938.1 LysR family transcriptional regulator [Nocardia sp. SYP-A9097]